MTRLLSKSFLGWLSLACILTGPARAELKPEDLVGEWRTLGNSYLEIRGGDGQPLQGVLTKASEGAKSRFGFSDGEQIMRNFELSGDTVSYELAYRQDKAPHTLAWVQVSNAPLNQGVIEGNFIGGSFHGENHEFQPGREMLPHHLIPKCPKIEGSINLGEFSGAPLSISLEEAMEKIDESEEPDPAKKEGYCHLMSYGGGGVAIRTADIPGGGGTFSFSPTFGGCDVELYWKEFHDPRGEEFIKGVDSVLLSWTDDGSSALELFNQWDIRFIVYAFGAIFTPQEGGGLTLSNAFLDVQMDLDAPSQMAGPLYISGDLSSIITYSWSNGGEGVTSWTQGSWSFTGMAGVMLELRRGGYAPVAKMNLSFNEQGELQAVMTLTEETSWSYAGYTMQLESCSIEIAASLKDRGRMPEILGGDIKGRIVTPNPLEGDFGFTLAYREDIFSMALDSRSDIKVFGGDLKDLNLQVNLDANTLEFDRIYGSVTFKHPDLEIGIRSFILDKGELTHFLGSGNVDYKSFQLNVSSLEYKGDQTPQILEVSASLALGWSNAGAASADIRDFNIDTNGVVSSFSISANIQASPVEVAFNAAFTETEFSGRFRGTFAGGADFGGTVVIGSQPSYSYGYLSIFFNIRGGVPIGQTGLKLLGLNGAFGCNYVPANSPLGRPAGPYEGIFYIQAGMTIGDAAGLASLNGTVSMVLGRANAVGIAGTVQVTQRTPYFRGTLSCNYTLGSGEVSGSLTTTVKIPTNGRVVSINNNTLNYRMGNGSWELRGRSLGGDFFSFLRLRNGHINLRNSLTSSISSMTGTLGGRISGGSSARWAYPSDFRCSSERYDFGVAANFSAHVSGDLNASLATSGVSGSFGVHVALSGRGSLRLRSGWFGFDCASVGLSANGNIRARNRNGDLSLAGTMTFSDSSGWISKDLSFSAVL